MRRRGMVPYHYIIDKNGQTVRYNDLDLNVGSTLTDYVNKRAIQIALVGNFNIETPTDAQYKELNRVIAKLITMNPGHKIQIVGHRDIEANSCPGKNFDFGKVRNKKTITFHLSRYYSPQPGQSKYYSNKDYLSDVAMNCGLNKDGTPSDCSHTANGHLLTDLDRGTSVACDTQYFGKKIFLEGIWIVTCNDGGSAVKGNHLDIRCGYGEKALNGWNSCPTWVHNGYLID